MCIKGHARRRGARCAAAPRCTGSASRGLTATPAPATTACAPTLAASTLACWSTSHFDRELRVRDLDRAAVQHFVDWLTTRTRRAGRLCDRSIANTLTPLRLALDAAVAEGLWMPTRPSGSCCRGGGRVAMVDMRATRSDARGARSPARRGTGEVAAAVRTARHSAGGGMAGE